MCMQQSRRMILKKRSWISVLVAGALAIFWLLVVNEETSRWELFDAYF
ncbi:hypothetical protein [Paenibacillus kobensis]|nr:hypothetical protein [Paenibacillus kobensis]